MEINSQTEKNCAAFALMFQQVIGDMKNSTPVWEDFTSKATRLHTSLRSTINAATSFLEAFQKVADVATNTKGATKDIGSALTRLCMRHRSIESKLKTVTSAIMEAMVVPLQDKMEDWKKIVVQLEKDRNRETKKSHQDVKKALSDTSRLQKKVKKGRCEVQKQLDESVKDLREKMQILEENERNAVRAALIEERSRYCLLIDCLKPFVDGEITMLGDVTHLQEIMDSLCHQAVEPQVLPDASEQIICDISQSPIHQWNCQSPLPRSPAHSVTSSKSSLSSLSSSSNSSSLSPSHRYQQLRTNSESFTRDSLTDSLIDGAADAMMSGYSIMSSSAFGHWPGSPPCKSTRQRDVSDERPHTISSAYERSHHSRAALNSHTFQPPSSQGGSSVPTTPNPHIMCIQSPRTRPHSLARNIELAEIFCRGGNVGASPLSKNLTGMTTSVDSSLINPTQNMQIYADLSQSDHNLPCSKNPREDGSLGIATGMCREITAKDETNQQHAKAHVTENTEGEKRKGIVNGGTQQFISDYPLKVRSIHHSLSCSTIVKDQNETRNSEDAYKNTNENFHELIYAEVPRRSSMFITDRPSPPVRRVLSVAGPDSLQENHDISHSMIQPLFVEQQQRGASRMIPLHSNTPAAMGSLQSHHQHSSGNNRDQEEEDFLLPPSPFRSPDDFEDVVVVGGGGERSTTFVKCFGSNRHQESKEETSPEILYGSYNVWQEKSGGGGGEKEYLNPWQAVCSLLTMPSPDETTPTNENQPTGFTMASQKTNLVGQQQTQTQTQSVLYSSNQSEMSASRESAI